MHHTYIAYGLRVESEIAIPEFCPVEDCSSHLKTVQIRLGQLVIPPLQSTPSACRCYIQPDEGYLEWPQAGLFRVRNGEEIVIDPTIGADEQMLRTFLLGAAFGLLLHQQRNVVLHASAIALGEGAIVFVGDRGAGKSTTAALFQSHGYPLLTDDVTVLHREPSLSSQAVPSLESSTENVHAHHSERPPIMVVPSFPHIRLWPESITSLGQQPEQFPLLNDRVEKRLYSSPNAFASRPYPLIGIYVLDWGDDNQIVPLKGHAALEELMHNWYCARFGDAMLESLSATEHFKQFADVVNHVPVYELVRKESLEEIGDMVPLVENHVKTLK